MKKLFFVISGLFVFWIIFALFDFKSDDVVTIYSVRKYEDSSDGIFSHRALSAISYRVRDHSVVSEVGGSVFVYKDCEIFDNQNWKCTASDDSVKFCVRRGEYFYDANIKKYPHLDWIADEERKTNHVSRFLFIVAGCVNDFLADGLQWVACTFRPFIH